MGKSVRSQTEWQRVCLPDRFLDIRHGVDRRKRSKRFLPHYTRRIRDVYENRHRKEITRPAQPLPPRQDTCSTLSSIRDQCLHRLDAPRIRKGSHLGRGIEAIANDHGICLLSECPGKRFVDGTLNIKASWGRAHLASIARLSYS